MRKREFTFLFSVAVIAAAFCVMSIAEVVRLAPYGSPTGAVTDSTAGEPRDVDVGRIGQLLRSGHLSDHEADFYEEFRLTLPSTAVEGERALQRKGQRESESVK
jgi:hypothetical protein